MPGDLIELPSSRESEEAILGTILINPQSLNRIPLNDADFYLVRHQFIYRAAKALGADDLNLTSLAQLLSDWGRLDEIGGQGYLLSLASRSPNAYNYDVYVKIIKDKSARRRIIEVAERLATAAYDSDKNISESISNNISDLVQTASPIGGAVHVEAYLKDLYTQVEERAKEPKEIYGLATGLSDFDRITHGLQKGEELILSGSPGTGKTLLAVQLAFGMAERGHPGVIYELEMSGVALVRRQVSAMSGITTHNMRSGRQMNESWNEFASAIGSLEKMPLYISDQSSWTTIQIRADLARMKQEYGVEWFVVDYMENLADAGERDERMAKISKNLHDIAKDLNLAALVLQSVTKQGFNRSQGAMEHVSGPHNVAHEADDIVIMTKGTPENQYLENVVTLTWDKKREADDAGILSLYKVPGLPLFQQYKIERQDEVIRPSWYDN